MARGASRGWGGYIVHCTLFIAHCSLVGGRMVSKSFSRGDSNPRGESGGGRTAALQDPAEVRSRRDVAKRLGVRESSRAFTTRSRKRTVETFKRIRCPQCSMLNAQ